MISRSVLEKAAQQNIIDSQQVEPLYRYLSSQASSTEAVNREEPLKFIRSFGDVFITLGIILLVIAINMTQLSGYYYLVPALGFVFIAEWLVRVRRLALPGIAILLAILYFVYKAINFTDKDSSMLEIAIPGFVSLMFYLRYKMPFSLLPLALSLVVMVIFQLGIDVINNPVVFVVLGGMVFLVAMWFDSRDTRRESHLSDSAFWLHLLASPLIVHGAMVTLLFSNQQWLEYVNKQLLMVIFFAAFFLLALFVDRRAMLVSTQLYVIYSLTTLFKGSFDNSQNVMIYILILLALFVIYFGTYWYKTRRFIFSFMAASPVCRYVPDMEIKDLKT